MRSSLIISTVLATAAVTVSAETNCNPSYNVPTSGECFTNCNIKAGAKFLPNGFTMNPTSPYFLDSLKLMCTKGTSEYTAFMTQSGMCMAGCKDDPTLFVEEFADACAWYGEHRNDECAGDSTTASNSIEIATNTTTAAPEATETHETTSIVPDATETIITSTEEATTEETNVPTDDNEYNLVADANAAADLKVGGLTLVLAAGVAYLVL